MERVVRVAIDIETDINPAAIAQLGEPEVALGNLKDPVKIEEKRAEAKRKQVERAALSPYTGRVLAIGIAYRTIENEVFSQVNIRNRSDENQDKAEEELFKWLDDEGKSAIQKGVVKGIPAGFATFNGCLFDVPFLTIRSCMTGAPRFMFDTNTRTCSTPKNFHLDVMQCLSRYEVGHDCKSLKHYATHILKKLCVYEDDGIDKSKMGEVPDELVTKLCQWDVVTTLELAEWCHSHLP